MTYLGESVNHQAKRILVVEDNEEYRDVLGRHLGTLTKEYPLTSQ